MTEAAAPPPRVDLSTYEKVLTKNVGVPNAYDIDVYESRGGYAGLKKAIASYKPADLIELVKSSGLRGRGGGGLCPGPDGGIVPPGAAQEDPERHWAGSEAPHLPPLAPPEPPPHPPHARAII